MPLSYVMIYLHRLAAGSQSVSQSIQPIYLSPDIMGLTLSTLVAKTGPRAVIHACTLEDESQVGAGAQVLDKAIVKKHAALAPGAVLPPGKVVPSGQVSLSSA